MGKALFRFYEELNDWLPPGKRKKDFEVPLEGKKTAREIIETLGVPPAKVDLLLVNGQSVDLDDVVEEGDRISVYPVFERLNIKGVSRVREKPLRELRFIVDKDLEALAASLKTLGLDVILGDDLTREQVLIMVRDGGGILLTQQGDLPGLQGLDRMIVLKPGSLHEQINQVIDALDLGDELGQEREHERKKQREASQE
jgi:sulfur carrier protein ThiS